MRNLKDLFSLLFASKVAKEGTVDKSYIAKFLPQNPVIVEAGSHIGLDTREMSKIWPDAKIFAFEPIPELFTQLKNNTAGCPNVKCFQIALGDKSGKTIIHQSSGASDGSSSLLTPKAHLEHHPEVFFEKELEVEVITIPDWMKTNSIANVDFFWLDLQGFELDVLKKAEHVLKNTKVVYTEVSIVENYQGGALYKELKEWLESLGFKVNKEEIPWEDGGNVLFVRE
jgi:FkbM family methyltransferase